PLGSSLSDHDLLTSCGYCTRRASGKRSPRCKRECGENVRPGLQLVLRTPGDQHEPAVRAPMALFYPPDLQVLGHEQVVGLIVPQVIDAVIRAAQDTPTV